MLRDLVEFVRNPYPWYLAPMGYVRELTGIADRGRALAPHWQSHLTKTCAVIEDSVAACNRHRSVLVVGSGNLLDIPLETLSRRFDKVLLLDILHSSAVRRAVRAQVNVELLSADVTGVAHRVFQAARHRRVQVLPKSVPPALEAGRFDLIISANLLSQLGVIPCSFLKAHCPAISPARLAALTQDLIETHLSWLSGQTTRTCLITDVLRIEHFADGDAVEWDIVEGVPLPVADAVWDWQIAPMGSIYRDRAVIHRVQAYRDFAAVAP